MFSGTGYLVIIVRAPATYCSDCVYIRKRITFPITVLPLKLRICPWILTFIHRIVIPVESNQNFLFVTSALAVFLALNFFCIPLSPFQCVNKVFIGIQCVVRIRIDVAPSRDGPSETVTRRLSWKTPNPCQSK